MSVDIKLVAAGSATQIGFFRTSTYEAAKNVNPKRALNTCQWFLRHHHFSCWRGNPSNDILWVTAAPGFGKSVLARSLIDETLTTVDSKDLVIYYFFKDNNEQNTVAGALTACLHQLFCTEKGFQLFMKHGQPAIKENGDSLKDNLDRLWRLLIDVCNDPLCDKVVCVLDGLDECKPDDRQRLIELLAEFHLADKPNQSSLKFLITSRPRHDIEEEFFELCDQFPSIHLSAEIKSLEHEIDAVIDTKIAELARKRKLSESTKSCLHHNLRAVPNRTYLWLSLVWDRILQSIARTEPQFNTIINELPLTVEEAYEGILDRCPDHAETRRILGFIIGAERLLTLAELDALLAIEAAKGARTAFEEAVEGEELRSKTLQQQCGGFVVVVDGTVHLLHQTAKDFLLNRHTHSSGPPSAPAWKHSLYMVDLHQCLAESCLWYLLLISELPRVFSTNGIQVRKWSNLRAAIGYCITCWKICDQSGPDLSILRYEQSHLAHYAAQYWLKHLFYDHGIANAKLLPQVWRFLDSTLWSHVMQPYQLVAEADRCKIPELQQGILTRDDQDLMPSEAELYRSNRARIQSMISKNLLKLLTLHTDQKISHFVSTMMHVISKANDTDTMMLMLAHGAFVDPCDKAHKTPLHIAASEGLLAMSRVLIDAGADVSHRSLFGFTPLHRSSQIGHVEGVELLLQFQAPVNAYKQRVGTPLYQACKYGHREVASMLLSYGAEVEMSNGKGRTLLHLACEEQAYDAVHILLDIGANYKASNIDGTTALHIACQHRNYDITRLLLARGCDPNACDKWGLRPLHIACIKLDSKSVALLIAAGCNVDAEFPSNSSSLDLLSDTTIDFPCEDGWQRRENDRAATMLELLEAGARWKASQPLTSWVRQNLSVVEGAAASNLRRYASRTKEVG